MTHLVTDFVTDVAAIVTYAVLFGIYFLVVNRRGKKAAYRTVQSINQAVRDEWVRFITQDPSRGITGVQTLRNTTMAATFFASTAVLLIIGTLNMVDQADRFSQIWGDVVLHGAKEQVLWTIKVLMIVAVLFAAFFAFAMSVRFFNHVGYQIALPSSGRPEWLSVDAVAAMMRRAGHYYSLGMRAYFLAVPLVFWLFGPLFMIASTLITVFIMATIERPLEQVAKE